MNRRNQLYNSDKPETNPKVWDHISSELDQYQVHDQDGESELVSSNKPNWAVILLFLGVLLLGAVLIKILKNVG